MWNRFLNLAKFLIGYSDRLERCERHIDDLQREVRELTTAVRLLTLKIEYIQESQKEQHEKLLFQLENQLLKFEKRLPPPTN